MAEALTRYVQLLGQIDAFEARVEAGQGAYLQCGRGCDGCCRTRRTAWAVEVASVRRWLAEAPPALLERLQQRRQDPSVLDGDRCVFLNEEGACDVYPVRPVICRTHGPAAQTEEGLVWCGLNFEGIDAEAVAELVPSTATLDLDRLNTILVLINNLHLAAHPGDPRPALEAALDPDQP